MVDGLGHAEVTALIAGSGNPQVQAGVVRLLSLLPGINLTPGSGNGQRTPAPGVEDVQDGLRPQAEIKGGEANPVPRSTAAR
jgi:hypothetical protein